MSRWSLIIEGGGASCYSASSEIYQMATLAVHQSDHFGPLCDLTRVEVHEVRWFICQRVGLKLGDGPIFYVLQSEVQKSRPAPTPIEEAGTSEEISI